jgi:hypothetical protein
MRENCCDPFSYFMIALIFVYMDVVSGGRDCHINKHTATKSVQIRFVDLPAVPRGCFCGGGRGVASFLPFCAYDKSTLLSVRATRSAIERYRIIIKQTQIVGMYKINLLVATIKCT